eukprot:c659_g2_i1 orf=1-159(-)
MQQQPSAKISFAAHYSYVASSIQTALCALLATQRLCTSTSMHQPVNGFTSGFH